MSDKQTHWHATKSNEQGAVWWKDNAVLMCMVQNETKLMQLIEVHEQNHNIYCEKSTKID